jgi:hypothetical protein
MSKKLILAAFAASLTCSAAALADSQDLFGYWTAPVNGSVSAVMMKDGDVMMKVKVPPKEFEAMMVNMKNGGSEMCKIEEIYPDAKNTMILVCRPGS